MRPSIRIVEPGLDSSIQDDGRADGPAVGLPRAGFVDPATARWLNATLGNPPGAAIIETRGGLVVDIEPDIPYATSTTPTIVACSRRSRVRVDPHPTQRWAYLAVGGSIDVASVGGSRSHDTLNGIGPLPLAAGATLRTGDELDTTTIDRPRRDAVIPCHRGPQSEPADANALGSLLRVTGTHSRVSVDLDPEQSFDDRRPTPSGWMPVVPGAVVVTRERTLRVLLANHPPLTGLPIIAVVSAPDGLGSVAQARDGDTLRLEITDAAPW